MGKKERKIGGGVGREKGRELPLSPGPQCFCSLARPLFLCFLQHNREQVNKKGDTKSLEQATLPCGN